MIRITSPTFADVDPSDPDRAPPLTSCSVVSHDGKKTYNVIVRGNKQPFPDTKSVLEDKVKRARILAARKKRNVEKKRKAEKKAADANPHADSTPNKKRKEPEPDTPTDEVLENNDEDMGGSDDEDLCSSGDEDMGDSGDEGESGSSEVMGE